MAKIIAGVIGALLFVVYSALFVFWNATTTADLITFKAGSEGFWVPSVPVGFLPLVGLIIGAILMAVMLIFPWSAQRGKIRELEAKVQKAVLKLREQKTAIAMRDEQLTGLSARLQELSEVTATAEVSEAIETSIADNSITEDILEPDGEESSSA